ncbi:hypothetical protein RUM43_009958 [Polyplax serrata]|uniref:ABCG1 n=1 Tax=Polyplax serrata TaxID=468196 RepID=A0AAN8P6V3_POLSC
MKGSITINGQERNLNTYKKLSCYIMQDNQLHANLTVEEAMKVATNLKLEKSTSKSDKETMLSREREMDRQISEILDTLGLQEHRKTMTSNLSGGQKKRLSIALELVNNPPIMFFDEPTSGLDSSSCFQCISLLKSLSRGGRTIICTIHQPSARLFEMFDHLYTLAEGQCVYQGSTKHLVPFLSTLNLNCPSYHNPASFIIEVSCGEYGDNVKKLVAAIENGKNDIRDGRPLPNAENLPPKVLNELANATNDIAKEPRVETDAIAIPVDLTSEKNENANATLLYPNTTKVSNSKRYPTSEFHQFWIVLKRTLLFSRRDWTLMYLRLFAHILVGCLIGALYYDIGNDGAKVLSNLGFLFFNMLFLMYTSMTITILSFPLEMPVLIKENFNRWYSLRSYYLAITVSDIPFQAIFCIIYVTIVYFLTSQPPELSRFLMFLSACLLISFDAQSVGLVVGAAMNVQNGVFLAPVMSVPFLLFSGFFVSFDAIPIYLRWITYLSYIRYGFEGTALATYGFAREKLKCFQKEERNVGYENTDMIYCHFRNPTTTLEELDMLDADFTVDIVALVIIFFILRISAFLFLRWKLKSTR